MPLSMSGAAALSGSVAPAPVPAAAGSSKANVCGMVRSPIVKAAMVETDGFRSLRPWVAS